MSTVSDLIKGSLRLLGVTAAGETPSSAELSDGLSSLNDLLEDWSNDGLLIYSKVIESVTLVAGTGSYTIGTSGDFNTARPQKITEIMSKQVGSDIETPVRIIEDSQEWARIVDKTTQGTDPECVFYNPTHALGTLYVWPVPSTASSLVLHSIKPLTAYSATSDTVTLPPGYKKALRYDLAIELAPEYGKEPSMLILGNAAESKARIMRVNTKPALLASDAAGLTNRGRFNIYTGE